MIEFTKWILVFIASGLVAGLLGFAALNRLVGHLPVGAKPGIGRLEIFVGSIFVLSVASWLLISPVNLPERIASIKVEEISGVSGLQTADLDTTAAGIATQSHAITLNPGRTDRPLTVRYTWSPPRFAIELPEVAAVFLSGAGQKGMKIGGVPPCPETFKGRVGEYGSCAYRDSSGRFIFAWNVSGLTDTQEISLTIRLGATAVEGNFEVQFCTSKGDYKVCGDKEKSNVVGPGDYASVLYGDETVEAHRGDMATSKDGVLTVDGTNGAITLKTTITNPFGLTAQQLLVLGMAGTVLGALLGNGILFAILSLRKPKSLAEPIRVPAGANRPRKRL